ncbi:hypothetical protein BC943DRAFT_123283 [Umbelopsis sp. AD052]|nr:hypothetical protein BC943DRAFT_123283 [Umbelopsis sp. AD052]
MKFSLYLAAALVLTLTGTSARPAIKGTRLFAANNGGKQHGHHGSVPQAVHNAEQLPHQNAAADVSAAVKEPDYLLTVTVPIAEASSSVVLQQLVANMHITKAIPEPLVPVVTPVASAANVASVQSVQSASPVAAVETKPKLDNPARKDALPTLIPADMVRKMEEVIPAAASAALTGKSLTTSTSSVAASKTITTPTTTSVFDLNAFISDLFNHPTTSATGTSAKASSTAPAFDIPGFVSAVLNPPTKTATSKAASSTFNFDGLISAIFNPPTKTATSTATSSAFNLDGLISAILNPPAKTSKAANPIPTGFPLDFDFRKFLTELDEFIKKLLEFIDKFTTDHLLDGKKLDTFNIMEKSKQPNLVYTFKLFRDIVTDSQASLHAIMSKEKITLQDAQALVASSRKSLNQVRRLQQEYGKSMDGKKSEIDLTAVTFLDPVEIEKALKGNEKVDISRITMSSDLFSEYTEQYVQKTQALLDSIAQGMSSGPVIAHDVQAVATPTGDFGSSKSTPKPAEAVEEIPRQSNLFAVTTSEEKFEEFDNIVNDATVTVMAKSAEPTSHQ